MTRFPTGGQIRQQRRKKRLTQSALAAAVGISTAYLNLIENEKRPIGGALLKRIAAALGVEPSHLSGSENLRLTQDLLELARIYPDMPAEEDQALQLIAAAPDWARAFLQLHRRYRDATETASALSDRLSQDSALIGLSHAILSRSTAIRSFAEILEQYPDLKAPRRRRYAGIVATEAEQLATGVRAMVDLLSSGPGSAMPASPEDEIDDFINYHRSHFPALEEAADALRRRLGGERPSAAVIAERLRTAHNLVIRDEAAGEAADPEDSAIIRIDGTLPEPSRRFALARALVGLEFGDLLAEMAADRRFISSDAAEALCRRALAGYAAGALLFPYDGFLAAAERWRYDLDRLAQQFGGSIEQIAHRLVTLRRPEAEGVPFAFLRSDPAGNLSKRFSTLGLHMPRFGGACPLWPLYAASRTPDRVVTQMALMPEGERYLLIARCVAKRVVGYGQPETLFSIMIGCDAIHSSRIVYGDAYARDPRSGTPAGFACRSCSRVDCPQRAHPAILASTASTKDTRLSPQAMP